MAGIGINKTKNKHMKKPIVIATLTIVSFCAKAQVSSSASQTANLQLANAIEITYSCGSSTGSTVVMFFNTVNDYADGVKSSAQELTVRSNKRFGVTVNTSSAAFTYTGSASPNPVMPVAGVLALRVTDNNTGGSIVSPFSSNVYASLGAVSANLLSNCNNGGNRNFEVRYEATPGFAYPAGVYVVDVVYTATQL